MTTELPPTRLRLDIAYDGTAFAGWSRQPGLRTVQGEIEDALGVILRRFGPPPALTVAGRTDAGVHATGQVAHLDLTPEQVAFLNSRHRGKGKASGFSKGPAALGRRLNGIAGLNSDLYIRSVTLAPPDFDARFSALWRKYVYRIADTAAVRDPLLRTSTVWYPAKLDVAAMDAASRSLLGLHDFAAYCKPREGATTVRTLIDFGWAREPDGVLVATVRADAFCHSMVRGLVGAAVAVGQGKLPAKRLVELLSVQARSSEFKVMPAKGLALVEVGYPEDAELGARAEQTRARRPALFDRECTEG